MWSKLTIKIPEQHQGLLSGIFIVKGFLHYKTTTSQNVSSEAHVKIFFIS